MHLFSPWQSTNEFDFAHLAYRKRSHLTVETLNIETIAFALFLRRIQCLYRWPEPARLHGKEKAYEE